MSSDTFEDDRYCFVCGGNNPAGLRLHPAVRDGVGEIVWTPPKEYQGYAGILHGGILSTLLDEVMAYAAKDQAGTAATAEITTRFRAPVMAGREIQVQGRVTARKGRIIRTEAEVRQDGEIKAKSEAVFVAMPDPRG